MASGVIFNLFNHSTAPPTEVGAKRKEALDADGYTSAEEQAWEAAPPSHTVLPCLP